jgi:hypothetical protein
MPVVAPEQYSCADSKRRQKKSPRRAAASSVSGGIVHAHTRDPFLASLPKEALEALARTYDELLAKHVQNASQDGPQNQIESKLAIEAEVVESDPVKA